MISEDSSEFMFADFDNLSGQINKWITALHSIRDDGIQMREVADGTRSPVSDPVTSGYFTTLTNTFTGFAAHNGMVSDYIESHAKKLVDSKDSMKAVEESNTATLRRPR